MLFDHNPRWSLLVRRAGWALPLALVLLLLQSAFWSARLPLILKLAVAGVAMLSAVRPAGGLLVVAGLVPLGHVLITRVFVAYPFALSEALVLAFLAGYLWQQRRTAFETASGVDHLVLPAKLFALVVIASCLVQLPEVQVWHDYPLKYASSFLKFMAIDYLMTTGLDPRPWVDGRTFVPTAALLLEGIGLLLCARRLCAKKTALAHTLTNVIVAAGFVAAMLSFYEPLRVKSQSEDSLISILTGARWSTPAIPSVDTAGSYFILVAFLAAGIAASSRKYLLRGFLAAITIVGALWLTQTRSAIVAGLAGASACFVWLGAARLRWSSPLRAVVVAGVVALGLALYVVVYNPMQILASGGTESLRWRVLFAETALRMTAASPLVGSGIGRYIVRYPEFASNELLAAYGRNDAHNYFLWIGAELGLLGLGLFLWLLLGALANGWSRLRARPSDYRLLGTFAGVLACIVTWTIGQPLSIPQVAYTFWIVLGVASAWSPENTHAVTGTRQHQILTRIAVAATAVLVVGLVPIRAHRAISEIDLSRVRYGFYDSGTANGRDFQWAGPQARFFERSSVRAINIPLAAKMQDTLNGVDVDILVNGRLAHHLELRDKQWHDIRVNAPFSSEPFWRVDLHVTAIDVRPDLEDARRRVGIAEISTERQQDTP